MLAGLLLAQGACGSSAKPQDAASDRPETGGKSDAAASVDGGPDMAAAGATGAGGQSGAAGSDAGAAGSDAGAAGTDGGAAGSDGGAAGAPNTCSTADGGGADGASACAAGKAECGGAAGDCETSIATDVMNCGRCGRACGAGATCTNGLCGPTVLLDPTGVSNWCGAAFSATKAYMITCWGSSLSEVRVAALEPGADVTGTLIKAYAGVTVVAMRGILIDGDSVYYGLEASPSNLWKFPLDATDATNLTSAATFENNTRFDSLQLIGDTYWWNHNTHTSAGQIAPSTIQKRAKTATTGTASTTVVTLPGISSGVVVTASHLYWLEARTGVPAAIYVAPLAGGTVTDTRKLGDAVGGYLVRQGDHIYWTNKATASTGSVMRLKIDDDAATPEPVSTCLNGPTGLVADAGFVYFRQLDALYRAPLTGGAAEQLSPAVPAHDTQATQLFHVDAKYVYFAAGAGFGASTLVRVAK